MIKKLCTHTKERTDNVTLLGRISFPWFHPKRQRIMMGDFCSRLLRLLYSNFLFSDAAKKSSSLKSWRGASKIYHIENPKDLWNQRITSLTVSHFHSQVTLHTSAFQVDFSCRKLFRCHVWKTEIKGEPRSPALQADSLPAEPQGKPKDRYKKKQMWFK